MSDEIMIEPLDYDEVANLSLADLASRMDSILFTSAVERYGNDFIEKSHNFRFRPTVSKILSTHHVKQMIEEKQRSVCDLTFKCLLQMNYTEFTSAAQNYYVYGNTYDENTSWLSPTVQIRYAALEQFGIVSSRISMECFMKLVYFLGTGEELKSKKSTFKRFKKWLQDAQNPFSYFATHVLRAFNFDRNHRTPEVHASSKLSGAVLRMKKPSCNARNSSLELTNMMLNIWQPLIDILNNDKAHSIQGSEKDFEWLKSYLNDDLDTRSSNLRLIFEQMKTT